MTQLLERSERAKNLTDKGFQTATDAYQNATNILSTLENFEEVIKKNKDKAAQAESQKEEISGNLEDAKIITTKLNAANRNTKQNLILVQNDLKTAKVNIEEINKVNLKSARRFTILT